MAFVPNEIWCTRTTLSPGRMQRPTLRDNAWLLRTWLNHFSKDFIGLVGDGAHIQAAEVAANMPMQRLPLLTITPPSYWRSQKTISPTSFIPQTSTRAIGSMISPNWQERTGPAADISLAVGKGGAVADSISKVLHVIDFQSMSSVVRRCKFFLSRSTLSSCAETPVVQVTGAETMGLLAVS
jgi:hypothetical protein